MSDETERELMDRARHVVDVVRRASDGDAVLYVLGTLQGVLAQGARSGAEAMRERAARECDAAAEEEREAEGAECYRSYSASCAYRIRALPTDTSEESGR